jgi:acyl carrier protein
MKLQGLGGFKNLNELVLSKINAFAQRPTEFSRLFDLMFSERENVLAETTSGYRIKEITYGETRANVLHLANALEGVFAGYEKDSFIGLSMANGVEWIECFWAIMMAGYKPVLLNTRLPMAVLEETLATYGVKAVVSDSATYTACPTYLRKDVDVTDCDRAEESFTFGTEVIFMSSGTQGAVKLCAYTAKQFYYQICDTYYIIKECPQIRKGYEGKIKQLALLPFYHVFGFMAVYLWFGFFSRTFVFLKDLSPQTLLNTARRHKVTHIFAVPLVWETIYKTAMKTIRSKGEKTVKKVEKGLKIAGSGKLGKRLTHKAFGEIREQIFGDSVQFLISGGSMIKKETVAFLNAIGYHTANGYGMTEIGITSVELSLSDKERNTISIGKPFKHAQYKNVDGELYVKSDTRAARILFEGKETVTNYDEWFKTGDLATEEKGKTFIGGRQDDLIVGETGENLNPNIIEGLFHINGVEELCLFQAQDGAPTLLLSAKNVYSEEQAKGIKEQAAAVVKENGLEKEIKKIVLTTTPLMEANDFKISRKKVAKKYAQGGFIIINEGNFNKAAENDLQKRIRALFAEVLQKQEDEVGVDDDFFTSLGGSSLDYFTLISLAKQELGIALPIEKAQELSTIRAIENYIQRSSL